MKDNLDKTGKKQKGQNIWGLLLGLLIVIVLLCIGLLMVMWLNQPEGDDGELRFPTSEQLNEMRTEAAQMQPEPVDSNKAYESFLQDENQNKLIEYQIPDGFEQESEWISEMQSTKDYMTKDFSIMASVSVIRKEWLEETTAQDWIILKAEGYGKSKRDIQQIERNGYTIYYAFGNRKEVSKSETIMNYYFDATVELKDGDVYELSAYSDSKKEAMQIETYIEFLTIREDIQNGEER